MVRGFIKEVVIELGFYYVSYLNERIGQQPSGKEAVIIGEKCKGRMNIRYFRDKKLD